MEEESEKRKERLKAMRMEASECGNYNETENQLQGLSNPLVESPSGQAEFCAAPRFDYYTDPMAAFSANKKRNNVSPQVSQACYTPPRPRNPQSPIYTAQDNYSLDQRSQSQGVHHTFNPLGNPGQNSPFGTPQRSSPNAWGSSFGTPNNYFPPNSSIGGNFASPGIHRGGRPGFHYGQGRGNPGSGYRGSPSQGSGYRGSPYQGPGHRGSPYQGSAQGRSQWMGNSSSPVSVQRGRRGLGSHGCTSAESRPDLYYNKSMVEDPWKEMKPVIWKPLNAPSNNLDTPESEKSSWLPKSISAKKAKIPDAPLKSTPQQSLAEYLSASFNEAAGNESGKDGSGT
ncbi:protein SICKLE isoform X2 [Nicotiana tomentosiformis]|uniref:Translation initiation factor IF-2 isoform X2 n=1 Tax=Nicotiana tabacum TaxID=4097 RepID=A0A1S4AEC2_TOBAC|nr:protein SICKLE isoform X2 [Nicotiana tomentosiformis]XP_016474813.1 PREDICTED: translation initiation factor IF-2-like isoform X2 [Nicotiana tabacum]XP_018628108.1 protein SICKLE isoform X3 [Nicotiana tomentosiformis]